jgi:hypothetical protein
MNLVFQTERFGGRVVGLALGALLMGFVALIVALTQGHAKPSVAAPAASASVAWPDGFVELEESSGKPAASPPSASAPAAPSAAPTER